MVNSHQQIAIVDFGSQYTHLIARRLRELKVWANIYSSNYDLSRLDNLIGIIISGGPASVGGRRSDFDHFFRLSVPILGICFGHQLMAYYFGGQVQPGRMREYGQAEMKVRLNSPLLFGLAKKGMVWMSHGDSVVRVPAGFKVIASTAGCPVAAMADEQRSYYGLQFHPEVAHTKFGLKILQNFAFKICGAQGDWQITDLKKEIIKQIRQQVGRKKVFLLVSGGVDSTVAFALLVKALGKERVYGLYIDTGLMRWQETKQIRNSLWAAGFDNLHIKEAGEKFLTKLQGVYNPEKKRKIIGDLFLQIKEEVADKLKLNKREWLLGQGTIYPDTIETGGSSRADTIKTHHNRVEAITKLIAQGKVVEPLKDFYKDEVRQLGGSLGLSKTIINRHPFPGPGLAIRLLCSSGQKVVSEQKLSQIKRKVQSLVKDYSFGSLVEDLRVLPIKSVGVQGDNRTYAYPVVIRAKRLSWHSLNNLATAITNSIADVNRVLLIVQGSDIKAEIIPQTVTADNLKRLRLIDTLVQREIKKAGLYDKIWQFPVVLIPWGVEGKSSIVLRPVASQEAMTANFYPLPRIVLTRVAKQIDRLNIISNIYLDITNKPPATIEWE